MATAGWGRHTRLEQAQTSNLWAIEITHCPAGILSPSAAACHPSESSGLTLGCGWLLDLGMHWWVAAGGVRAAAPSPPAHQQQTRSNTHRAFVAHVLALWLWPFT
jgi:hypothetical protein